MAEQLSLSKDYMALASFFKARGRLSSPQTAVTCFGPCKLTLPHACTPRSPGRLSRQGGKPGAHEPQCPSIPPVTTFPCPCYLITQRYVSVWSPNVSERVSQSWGKKILLPEIYGEVWSYLQSILFLCGGAPSLSPLLLWTVIAGPQLLQSISGFYLKRGLKGCHSTELVPFHSRYHHPSSQLPARSNSYLTARRQLTWVKADW